MDIFLGKVDWVTLGNHARKTLTTFLGDTAGYELCYKVHIRESYLQDLC